ncbi:MAG: AAA family ATPase [Acidimicrobiales bacterium]|jgi:predicted ATP-binding protein involved in virulence
MRMTRLAIDNLFSCDHFELDQIDPNLTTIVGPNGSGKTNLARLFELITTALDWVEVGIRSTSRRPLLRSGI